VGRILSTRVEDSFAALVESVARYRNVTVAEILRAQLQEVVADALADPIFKDRCQADLRSAAESRIARSMVEYSGGATRTVVGPVAADEQI